MENYLAPGVVIQNQIDGNPGKRMTLIGNSGAALVGRRHSDEQPALAEYWNNKEEIING